MAGERSTIDGTVNSLIFQNEENGYTYLHYSSKEGNIKITEKLLKLGCDSNIKNKNNEKKKEK